MPSKNYKYLESELLAVGPFPVQDIKEFRLKITSEHGSTKWLSITGEQFKKIEDALLGVNPNSEKLVSGGN